MNDDGHRAGFANRVHKKRDHGDVIKVRMRHKDVINQQEFFELQVPDPGSRIDEDIMIHKQRRRALIAPANATAAPQNPHLHLVLMEFRKSEG